MSSKDSDQTETLRFTTSGQRWKQGSTLKDRLIADRIEFRVADKQTTCVGLITEPLGRQMFNGCRQDQFHARVRPEQLRAGDLSCAWALPDGFQSAVTDAVLTSFPEFCVVRIVQGHDETVVVGCQDHAIWKQFF